MKGFYLKHEQRSALAQELRKTHFHLGFGAPRYSTTVSDTYRGSSELAATNDNGEFMRRTNFTLGTDRRAAHTVSESSERFREFPVTNATVNERALNLTAHHFEFGHQPREFRTVSNSAFTVTPGQGGRVSPRSLQTHSFVLGTDCSKKKSVSQTVYDKKELDFSAKRKLQDIKGDLKATHFQLGSEAPSYATNNRTHFNPKTITKNELNEELKKDLKREHFALGTDKPLMKSTSHTFFNKKGHTQLTKNNEQLQDLRKTHFQFGNAVNNYTPTSSEYRYPQVSQPPAAAAIAASLRRTNFTFGTQLPSYKSSYTTAHSQVRSIENVQTRDKSIELASKISLGTDKASYLTVAKESYQGMNEDPRNTDKGLSERIRKSNFSLGNGKLEYSTSSGVLGKGTPEPIGIHSKAAQKTNFKYGHDPADFTSVARQDFTNKAQAATKTDGTLKETLIAHHFYLGSRRSDWGTEQKASYQWVQPAPELHFQYTF